MPVTAPADRHFLRGQVKPTRRHTPWALRLRMLRMAVLAGLCVWGGWRVVGGFAGSPTFQVSHISVTGNQRLSTGDVLALVDGLHGRNILDVHLEDWRGRLRACPWIADATMRRLLPATIEVVIVERRPMAVARVDEGLWLVDEDGETIDEYGPRYADLDLPILDGLSSGRGKNPAADERRAHLASRFLQSVRGRPDLARRISQVDVSDPRNAVVIVDQDPARVRLGDERFVERLQSYLELAPTLREHVPAIDYVDLRFGERVFIGAQSGGAVTVASAAASPPGRSSAPTGR